MGPFHGYGIGGVQLQGKIQYALKASYGPRHHGWLVYFRQAHIDIQHMSPRLLLSDTFLQNIIQVVFPQRLLEPGLTGGIDPFTDNDRTGAETDGTGVGGDHRPFLTGEGEGGKRAAAFNHRPDVPGSCAATPSPASRLLPAPDAACVLQNRPGLHQIRFFHQQSGEDRRWD